MAQHVTVIGAGPVGSLLARVLARRGYAVEVYESRSDPRRAGAAAGRSINLVLTTRGLRALGSEGLKGGVMELTVPVTGRQMHSVSAELTYQPYGKDPSECNHSISRGELNNLLVTMAEEAGAVVHFDRTLTDLDPASGALTFADGSSAPSEVVFGCDGAPSAVRNALVRRGHCEADVAMLGHGYKELRFPAGPGDSYLMRADALHIWPRGHHMLMGLPNPDGSFTGTIYLPHTGPDSFEQLSTPDAVQAFFEAHYPDAIPLVADLQAFAGSPTGELGTVRSFPWSHEGRVLLVGDAAHGIVPFFGQGLNCGFEDCVVLAGLLDGGGDLTDVFKAYDTERKPDTDAIADMALQNFVEMCEHVGDPTWMLRKRVSGILETRFPDRYRSRYAMVMYSFNPYHTALEAGVIHQQILDALCGDLANPEDVDLARAEALIAERLTPYVEANGVDLSF